MSKYTDADMNNTSIPKEAIAIYNKAFELAANGDEHAAIEEYKLAIENYPDFIEARNNLGELYSQMGESDKAIAAYHDALSYSTNYRLFYNLGLEYFKAEREEEALSYFIRSATEAADFADGNYHAGLIFYSRENYEAAERYLSAVVRTEPKNLKSNYMLSFIYYTNKQYEKAVECLNRIKDIADDTTFMNKYYGFCHYHLGNYTLAIEYLTATLETQPEYAKFKAYLESLTYENKVREIGGDVDEAIREMEEKMAEIEQSLTGTSRLSMLYIFKGENQKAERILLDYKERLAS